MAEETGEKKSICIQVPEKPVNPRPKGKVTVFDTQQLLAMHIKQGLVRGAGHLVDELYIWPDLRQLFHGVNNRDGDECTLPLFEYEVLKLDRQQKIGQYARTVQRPIVEEVIHPDALEIYTREKVSDEHLDKIRHILVDPDAVSATYKDVFAKQKSFTTELPLRIVTIRDAGEITIAAMRLFIPLDLEHPVIINIVPILIIHLIIALGIKLGLPTPGTIDLGVRKRVRSISLAMEREDPSSSVVTFYAAFLPESVTRVLDDETKKSWNPIIGQFNKEWDKHRIQEAMDRTRGAYERVRAKHGLDKVAFATNKKEDSEIPPPVPSAKAHKEEAIRLTREAYQHAREKHEVDKESPPHQ
jgi:hypothetical protein